MFNDPLFRLVVVLTGLFLVAFWTSFGFFLAWIFGYV